MNESKNEAIPKCNKQIFYELCDFVASTAPSRSALAMATKFITKKSSKMKFIARKGDRKKWKQWPRDPEPKMRGRMKKQQFFLQFFFDMLERVYVFYSRSIFLYMFFFALHFSAFLKCQNHFFTFASLAPHQTQPGIRFSAIAVATLLFSLLLLLMMLVPQRCTAVVVMLMLALFSESSCSPWHFNVKKNGEQTSGRATQSSISLLIQTQKQPRISLNFTLL